MLSIFDVMVLVDITSLNVTATMVETEMSVELSIGLTEEIMGAVVSVIVVLSMLELLSELLLQEIKVRLKRDNRIICIIFFILSKDKVSLVNFKKHIFIF